MDHRCGWICQAGRSGVDTQDVRDDSQFCGAINEKPLFSAHRSRCRGCLPCRQCFSGSESIELANCIGFINESVTYERPQFRNFQGRPSPDTSRWGTSNQSTSSVHPTTDTSPGASTRGWLRSGADGRPRLSHMGAGRACIHSVHERGRLPTFGVVSIMKSSFASQSHWRYRCPPTRPSRVQIPIRWDVGCTSVPCRWQCRIRIRLWEGCPPAWAATASCDWRTWTHLKR